MTRFRTTALVFVVLASTAAPPTVARDVSAMALVDRYFHGDFHAVVSDLGTVTNFKTLFDQLRDHAPAWIDAAPEGERERRALAAATFALEAARVDEWREWKLIVRPPVMKPEKSELPAKDQDKGFQPLNTLYWAPAPMLIEWGCRLMSEGETPRPIERWWQLAALAVAQRSEDPQFLIGDTKRGLGVSAGEILNEQKEITHLTHTEDRFPHEIRFKLAQGIARTREYPEDAHVAFGMLASHPDVGGEALVRRGEMFLRERNADRALDLFDEAERRTRDPYVLYLAAYLRGVALLEKKQTARAEAAFRRALAEWPGGQSASTTLAALLVRQERSEEPRQVIARMLGAVPAFDPWREFAHADDRFWPYLIARLRAEIKP
jgi:tetratricopeptide (TPR) repeat protein